LNFKTIFILIIILAVVGFFAIRYTKLEIDDPLEYDEELYDEEI
jgi:hypothetical protein